MDFVVVWKNGLSNLRKIARTKRSQTGPEGTGGFQVPGRTGPEGAGGFEVPGEPNPEGGRSEQWGPKASAVAA